MSKKPSQKKIKLESTDVVVIGAGLAGLQAAYNVQQAGKTVTLLEARDRVGGRTVSQQVGSATFDLGGQWLGPTQYRLSRLTSQAGIRTFPTFHEGKKVLNHDGKISTYNSSIPSISPLNLAVLQFALMRVERARKKVPVTAPMRVRDAATLDATSVETIKRKLIPTRGVRGIFDAAARVIFGAEPAELSLLHFLTYLNAGGGLLKLSEIEGGAQQERFAGGAQELSRYLESKLDRDIQFNWPVRKIVQKKTKVTVHSDHGSVSAKRVILAVPPNLAGKVQYEPAMPASREYLTQGTTMGQTIKCIATYKEPFWRHKGFSGEVVSTQGPITVIFDNTSYDGKQPALLAFLVGNEGRRWSEQSDAHRKEMVLANFAKYFGQDALSPTEYVEKDWAKDPWALGCPTASPSPGVWTNSAHSLREPVDRIHFAGTETATEWMGYMEGALESGERAASEVIKLL
ncbi:MAG: flavin monoamine oxidase family protein [Deltaproteobacteria bacterium]|nr:flavin monoamine oxidase family protein [Deltaproteobacteria bacterium]MBT6488629.1 flavin monoamine oxidase family protein [Deltaproteobacteria bacterium]